MSKFEQRKILELAAKVLDLEMSLAGLEEHCHKLHNYEDEDLTAGPLIPGENEEGEATWRPVPAPEGDPTQ